MLLYRFALFYFIIEALSKYKPPGDYIRRDDLTEGFLRYEFERLIFGGAYTWRGLFSEFYGIVYTRMVKSYCVKQKKQTEGVPQF